MSFFHSDSKTDLKVLCNNRIKFQLFECAQDLFSTLTAVCFMLLPHNPYIVPQYSKRCVCWPSCMGTVFHWKPFWSTVSVCFIGQCWYFNQQWTPVQAINKAGCVWIHNSQLREIHSCCVSFKSGFLEGFRRWRPSILAPQRNPDIPGSCSLASLYSLWDRSEPNFSKLRHTVCNFCMVHSAISRAHCAMSL